MSIEALTTSTSGQHLDPTSAAEWLDWVSTTATRNFLLSNPLVDWLELYGEQHGFIKDSKLPRFDERLEFVLFIMRKDVEFEAAIARHLSSLAQVTTIAHNRDDIRDSSAAEQTFRA